MVGTSGFTVLPGRKSERKQPRAGKAMPAEFGTSWAETAPVSEQCGPHLTCRRLRTLDRSQRERRRNSGWLTLVENEERKRPKRPRSPVHERPGKGFVGWRGASEDRHASSLRRR